jgi:hypothetical protein
LSPHAPLHSVGFTPTHPSTYPPTHLPTYPHSRPSSPASPTHTQGLSKSGAYPREWGVGCPFSSRPWPTARRSITGPGAEPEPEAGAEAGKPRPVSSLDSCPAFSGLGKWTWLASVSPSMTSGRQSTVKARSIQTCRHAGMHEEGGGVLPRLRIGEGHACMDPEPVAQCKAMLSNARQGN